MTINQPIKIVTKKISKLKRSFCISCIEVEKIPQEALNQRLKFILLDLK